MTSSRRGRASHIGGLLSALSGNGQVVPMKAGADQARELADG